MRLKIEQQSPQFTTKDITGKPILLSDYRGKKLMQCFFRYAGCPFCNLALFKIIERYPLLKSQGLNIIAFFQSAKELVHKYPAKQNPPFPLVSDPQKKIYKKFGVESSVAGALRTIPKMPNFYDATVKHGFKQPHIDGDFFLMPAYFLIGPPKFTIQNLYYSESFADEVPFIHVEDFLLFG